jgi:hypothetical protein
MEQANIEDFMTGIDINNPIDQSFLDTLREKITKVKDTDSAIKEFSKVEKARVKKGLELHMGHA